MRPVTPRAAIARGRHPPPGGVRRVRPQRPGRFRRPGDRQRSWAAL